jgi:CubicO group peptidase (beta-lactamase class C family)
MSGLTYGFMQANPVDAMYRTHRLDTLGRDLTLAEFVEKLTTLPLIAHPGTGWNYSHSTDVLARLIEIISGQRFDVFLTERLLDPLGMSNTTFHVPAGREDHFAACYVRGDDGRLQLQDDPVTSRFTKPTQAPFGGALVSTASDYMRFCRFMLARGGAKSTHLLGRKTVELMMANHLGGDMAAIGPPRFAESSYRGFGFGLGFSVLLDPAQAQILGTPGECGWGGIASTAFWIDPAEDLAVVLMTQLMPSSQFALRRQLRTLVYQAIID